jgi:hypothetical protein
MSRAVGMFVPGQIIDQGFAGLIDKYGRHGIKPCYFIDPEGDKILRAFIPSG